MPEKTGKSLEDWKRVLNSKSFEKHSQAVNFLKTEHGVSHGFANTIVTLSKEDNNTPEDLKPIYEALIDLGLKLAGKELTQRLENSGPFGTMCTHRVQISSMDQIDKELKGWLIEAYEKSK